MRFYGKYFNSNYEELISYYPRFYREVFEMVEILKVQGKLADGLEKNIEQTFLNSFIDCADEATIKVFESFLRIELNVNRSIEERRRFVKAYFVGFGRVSASMLIEMIQSYTGTNTEIAFEPFGFDGNNILYISIDIGEGDIFHVDSIKTLLEQKVPVHIKWQIEIIHRFPQVRISANEQIKATKLNGNYILGEWKLGVLPFVSPLEIGVIKMDNQHSVLGTFLNRIAQKTTDIVSEVVVNGSFNISITEFESQTIEDNVYVLKYIVPVSSGIQEIITIDLIGESGTEVFMHWDTSVTMVDDILMEHRIKFEEVL